MDWLIDHINMLLGILLGISEIGAAIVQVAFPQNKGVAGFLAGMIKVLQKVGIKFLE